MQNTTLAIAIPTYDRAEIVRDNLLSLISEIKEYSMPIYVSDNSPNEDTKNVINELKKQYEFLFYYKNTTDLGHDKNSFNVVQLPESDYVWLLGDSFSVVKGTIKEILLTIERYKPEIMSVNAANRDLDEKSGVYEDCNTVLDKFGWHLTLTGATIYSRNVLSTIGKVEPELFKNFPQLALIFNFLSKNCSFFWNNKKLLISSPKKGYWVSTMFSIFIDDWSNAISNLPHCYKERIKEKVIIEHSLKSNIFGLKALLKARSFGAYDFRLLRKYKKILLGHSNLNFLTLLMIAVFPKILLRTYLLIKRINSNFT
jgi:abequosyltransferase